MTTNARTDPESGLRFYLWEGRDYPSVTSIRRLIGMPFTLHNWVLSQIIERAILQHPEMDAMLARARKPRERAREANIIKEVKRWLRAAATEERDRAGDRGTRAHAAIADGTPLVACAPDIVGYVAQYLDFLVATGARVVWAERQCWNLTYGYAGTGDLLLEVPVNRAGVTPGTYMTDLKTSNGVYLDHLVQVMAYTMCEFVGENDRVDTRATQELHSANGMGILHLAEQSWEFIEISAEPSLFQGFVGGLVFARFLHDNNNSIDSLVENRTKGGTLVPALARSLRIIQGMRTENTDGNGTG